MEREMVQGGEKLIWGGKKLRRKCSRMGKNNLSVKKLRGKWPRVGKNPPRVG